MTTMTAIAISGFLVGISLIVAIGPQNALIIRQGIKRHAVIPVIAVCMLSDVILILGGTAGVGVLVDRAPIALDILKWLGVAYLAWFAYVCFRDGLRANTSLIQLDEHHPEAGTHPIADTDQPPAYPSPSDERTSAVATKVATQPQTVQRTWVKPVLAALAFTWLNPAAYVDVLVMLGGIANQHGPEGRWIFAAGAITASMTWFPFLAFASTRFSHVLSRPKVWSKVNIGIGVLMLVLCARLIMH